MLSDVDPRAILTQFGQGIGINDIAVDAGGKCRLGFDDVVVDIAVNEAAERFIVSAEIASLPPEPGEFLLMRYLALNYMALIMGTGAISIEPSSRAVRYVQTIALRGLDEAEFTAEMTRIVDRVEKLTGWLATERFDSVAFNESERINAFILSL
jgi:hypothetical protein